MHYVYILISESFEDKKYVGYTLNVEERLIAHNNGQVPSTASFKPWRISGYTAFADKGKALKFEKYLKSSSGRAFAKKRLL
ncbi:MAG: GIY-YIG nuclease family protein [Candidatus Omnitrophica bacterium]|nr:GIY-YIG nuclease family protein [Candidatus Omnitrophota bacterium]